MGLTLIGRNLTDDFVTEVIIDWVVFLAQYSYGLVRETAMPDRSYSGLFCSKACTLKTKTETMYRDRNLSEFHSCYVYTFRAYILYVE